MAGSVMWSNQETGFGWGLADDDFFFISRLLSQEPDLVWSETFQADHGNCIENVGQGFSRRIFEAWCTDSRVPRVA